MDSQVQKSPVSPLIPPDCMSSDIQSLSTPSGVSPSGGLPSGKTISNSSELEILSTSSDGSPIGVPSSFVFPTSVMPSGVLPLGITGSVPLGMVSLSTPSGVSSSGVLPSGKLPSGIINSVLPDLNNSSASAVEWALSLESKDDEKSSISTTFSSTTSTTTKQNKGIPLGILKQNNNMWTFLCNSIKNRASAERVLNIIQNGYSLEFETVAPTSRVVQRNYVSPKSEHGPWVTEQLRILQSQNSIRRVAAMEALFCLPLFVVPKDSGNGNRLIVDMRALNVHLRKRGLTLPTLSKQRAEYNDILGFWTYDLTSAYQHVEISTKHQKFFGIEWEGKTFLMTVCPYGCSTIPEMFQTVAGTPLDFLNEHGFCPDLTTAQDWHDLADGKIKLPSASRRFRIPTDQYLDDFGSRLPKLLRSVDSRTIVKDQDLKDLSLKLSQSFKALYEACGFAISTKSQPNPFTINTFLGYNIVIHAIHGTFFQIPNKKRLKSITQFQKILHTKRISLRKAASLAGRILRWKLVWSQYASLYARPIYHQIAHVIRCTNNNTNWNAIFTLSDSSMNMVHQVLQLLEPGPRQLLTAPVISVRDHLESLWENGSWKSYLHNSGKSSLTILSDASDHASCTWVSTLDIDETLKANEHTILTEQDDFSKWSLMTEEEIDTGSTHRELLELVKFYDDSECMHRLLQLLETRRNNGSTAGMIHLTDSQSASTILRKGSSKYPHLHSLVLKLYDLTRHLRHYHGWCVGWIRREFNQAADAGSKLLHDWIISPLIFQSVNSKYNFTLDAFASESERANSSLPFCSRYVCQHALGDARVVSFDHHVVWAFPPMTSFMILLTLRKWLLSPFCKTMVLCVPARHSATWWPAVWNSPWTSYTTTPINAATRVIGLTNDKKFKTVSSRFRFNLFLFKK